MYELQNNINNLNSQGKPKTTRSENRYHYGSEFDISIDMTTEFPLSNKPKPDQFFPNTFSNTQPVQVQSAPAQVKVTPNDFAESLITGTNSPSYHYIDILTPPSSQLQKQPQHLQLPNAAKNQPPISMKKFASSSEIPFSSSSQQLPQQQQQQQSQQQSNLRKTAQPNTPHYQTSTKCFSTSRNKSRNSNNGMSAAPNVTPKLYVFGFREEAKYQPHPFVSSHKPKTAANRQRSAKSELSTPRKFQKPFKLSKRRQIAFDESQSNVHNIVLGSFEELSQIEKYQGP